MWYDDDAKRTLEDKILRTVNFYAEKYGARPDRCYVNNKMMTEDFLAVAGCKIRTAKNVMPNHFWLGLEDNDALVLTPVKRG